MNEVPWQTVRIFISSTFADMHAERDYLVKQVFPGLRDWCERRRLHLVDIDLRWGVTETDATRNRSVVQVCLDRIDQCRPFFLCLLGQRYGWVPRERDIADQTFDRYPGLAEHVASQRSVTELEVLHAVTSSFRSQGLSDDWDPAEHAFFYRRDPSYLASLPSDPWLLRRIYSDQVEEDASTRDLLIRQQAHLRDLALPATGRPVRDYQALWCDEHRTHELSLPLACPSVLPENQQRWRQQWQKHAGVEVDGLAIPASSSVEHQAKAFNDRLTRGRLGSFTCNGRPLGAVIREDLQRAIEDRFPEHLEVVYASQLQRVMDQQAQFVMAASQGFIERGRDFGPLDDYADGDSCSPLVITAPAGLGKSTLLACWVQRRTEQGAHHGAVHARFIGASADTDTAAGTMRSVLEELRQARKLPGEAVIPLEPSELLESLPTLLAQCGEAGRTVIVLDALNQMQSGFPNLYWLPRQLPANIKLIVSFKTGEPEGDRLRGELMHEGHCSMVTVRPMEDLADRRALVRTHLAQHLKELDVSHLDALVSAEGSSNPLFLKVVLSELRIFGAFDQLGSKIRRDFGAKPRTAFHAILSRLESDQIQTVPPLAVAAPSVFGLLACARRGLSTDELVDLVSALLRISPDQRAAVESTTLLLLRQVRPFLGRREGRSDFFFESFRIAARERYVAGEDDTATPYRRPARDWHRALARYFEGFSNWEDHDQRRRPQHRKLAELCFHMAQAEMTDAYCDALTDGDFLLARVTAFGPNGVDEDYAQAQAAGLDLGAEAPDLELIRGAIRLASNVLVDRPEQLAHQLLGRLEPGDGPRVSQLLRDLAARQSPPWLCPIRPCFPRPGGPLLRQLRGHDFYVSEVAVLPDGRRAISGSLDRTLRIWDLRTGETLRVLRGPSGMVEALSITPDGRRAVVCGSNQDRLELWNLDTGQREWCKQTTPEVSSIAVTPDTGRIVALCGRCTRIIFDADSGRELDRRFTVDGGRNPVVTPDGRSLVVTTWDAVLVRDLETDAVRCTLERSGRGHWGIVLTPDGQQLIADTGEGRLGVWCLQSGRLLRTLATVATRGHFLDALAITPDARLVLASFRTSMSLSGSDNTIVVLDFETGRKLAVLSGHTDGISSIAVTPDSRCAVTASKDCSLAVWDLRRTDSTRVSAEHKGIVDAVAVSPDGSRALSGAWDHTVALWDTSSGERLSVLEGHNDNIHAVAFFPDGRRAISGSGDGVIIEWDAITGRRSRSVRIGEGRINALALAPDGRWVAVGARKGTITIWDLHSWELLRRIEAHTGLVKYLVPDDGGMVGMTPARYAEWKRTDMEGEDVVTQQGDVLCLVVTPDGRLAISGSNDNTIAFWDPETGAHLQTLVGHGDDVLCLELTPDGRHIFSGSKDGSVALWDPGSGQRLAQLDCGNSAVQALSSMPGGRHLLVAAGRDLVLWDWRTGEVASRFRTQHIVNGIARTGTTIIAGCTGGKMYFLGLQQAGDE